LSRVCVHCQYDPLDEIWLGDCYPAEFYKNFEPKIRSVFERITDITHDDLDKFQTVLKSLGIKVCRPEFTQVEDYLDSRGTLLKPPIAPRDNNIVLGNTLYHLQNLYQKDPWQSYLDEYQSQGSVVISAQFNEMFGEIIPPSIIRIGQDILIDRISHLHSWESLEQTIIPIWSKDYNVIVCNTDGHADSVFCAAGTGRILTSHWKHDYSNEFPGWDIFHLPKRISNQFTHLNNAKEKTWWVEGIDTLYPAFNRYIENFAMDWIGCAHETVFEVNSLMINNDLIITTGMPDQHTQQWFKKHKIEWIPIEMRTRGFWDSGVHCLTVDIRRQGKKRKIINEQITN